MVKKAERAPRTENTVTDLDGNGFGDLAVAVPGEDLRTGLINLIFGGTTGLTTYGNSVLKQGFDGLLETPETNDEFGTF